MVAHLRLRLSGVAGQLCLDLLHLLGSVTASRCGALSSDDGAGSTEENRRAICLPDGGARAHTYPAGYWALFAVVCCIPCPACAASWHGDSSLRPARKLLPGRLPAGGEWTRVRPVLERHAPEPRAAAQQSS